MAILYENNFNSEANGALSGWTNIGGASFAVTSTNPILGAKSFAEATWGSLDIALYTGISAAANMCAQCLQAVQLDSSGHGGSVGLVVRASVDGQDAYLIVADFYAELIYLYKRVGGSYTEIGHSGGTASPVAMCDGERVWLKLEASGTTIRWKAWRAVGPEQAGWTESVTDSAVSSAGYAGVIASANNSDHGSTTAKLDNFSVGTAGQAFDFIYATQPNILNENNFEAETAGSAPTGWTNKGTASFAVSATNPVFGTQSVRASTFGSLDVVLYTAPSAQANMVAQIAQTVQMDGSNHGANCGLILRANSSASDGYLFLPSFGTSLLLVYKKVSGSYTEIGTPGGEPFGFTAADGDKVFIKAEIVGTTLRWNVFKATDGSPDGWTQTITDASISAAGYAGVVEGYNEGSAGSSTSIFDMWGFGSPGCRFNYTYNYSSINGQDSLVLIPTSYDATAGANLVTYHHGAGEDFASFISDPLKSRMLQRALCDGYIVASSTAHGENWGNSSALSDYSDFYDVIAGQFTILKHAIWAQSMGGMSGLLTMAADSVGDLVGWYGVYPVCSLADMYDGGAGTYQADIETAFGFADASGYAAATSGHDPVLLSASAFDGFFMRFVASSSDSVVDKTANTDAMRTLVTGHAAELGLLTATGNHGDPSHFDEDDFSDFLARAFSGNAAIYDLAAVATGETTVDLTWTDIFDDETSFKIRVWTQEPNNDLTGLVTSVTAVANAESKTITGLTAGTLYYFSIQKVVGVSVGALSNTATATTDGTPAPAEGTATREMRRFYVRQQLGMVRSNGRVFAGSAVGDVGDGTGQPLQAGDEFLGFALNTIDNRAVPNGGLREGTRLELAVAGDVWLTVSGVSSITALLSPVYASDDATFTLTSSGNSALGKVIDYDSARPVGLGRTLVRFEGKGLRSL